MRILIIEDDATMRQALQRGLQEAGHAVDVADNGMDAGWSLQTTAYDTVVLDLGLPGRDGLSVLRKARQDGCEASILILSARDAIEDRIAGLDAGADDYLIKPFSFDELHARLRSLLRRRYGTKDPIIRLGSLVLDTRRRQAVVDDRAIRLTAREYAMLEYLALRRGEVVSRQDLLQNLYAFAEEPDSNIVEHFIARLRRKLGRSQTGDLIQTRRGEGYVLAGSTPTDAKVRTS